MMEETEHQVEISNHILTRDVRLLECRVNDIEAYKVLGGNWTVGNIAKNTCLDQTGEKHSDWQALYLQFRGDHALGTIPYRWETKSYSWDRESGPVSFTEAQLLSVVFKNLHVVVMDDVVFHDGSICGAKKAEIVKKTLGIKDEFSLMDTLGNQGKVALVRETEDEWELLVPFCLLPKLSITETINARFKRHPAMPVTQKWCKIDKGSVDNDVVWRKWEDGIKPECIHDITTEWIDSVLLQ